MELFRPELGDIRKITIGDVKEGFSFKVGQEIMLGKDKIFISKIVRNEDSFFIFGSIIYLIYAKGVDGNEFVWNYIENQPVRVECNIMRSDD